MNIAILTIGDELLRGKTINTNAAFLGENLQSIGLEVQLNLTVPDRPEAIRHALDWLLPQADVVITTGGLGSTGDDLTRDTVAAYLNLPLAVDMATEAVLTAFLDARGATCHNRELVMRQALAPRGGISLANAVGTAPGLWIPVPGQPRYIVLLPGPPHEMRPMVVDHLLPRLAVLGGRQTHTRLYYVACASELWVEEQVRKILADLPAITPAYCAEADHVKLFLSGPDPAQVEQAAVRTEAEFGHRLLRSGYSSMPEEMVAMLRERGAQLATAESCTGGMIAAAITDIAGSSEVFAGSIVAYANRIKQEQLDVSETVLRNHGAVSAECVAEMVDHLCDKFKTEAGIAVSGIAGPGGGSGEKPVGLVFVAVRWQEQRIVRKFHFSGNRTAVRQQTVAAAWFELRQLLLA